MAQPACWPREPRSWSASRLRSITVCGWARPCMQCWRSWRSNCSNWGLTAARWCSGPKGPLFNAQFLDAVAQGAEAHAEELGGGCLVVSRFFERLDDGITLDVFELSAQRAAGRRGFLTEDGNRCGGFARRADRGAQFDVFRRDQAVGAQSQGALQDVFQL